MDILIHALLFLLAGTALWLLSGILVDAVERVAKRYNRSGFGVAFFVLGFLTSIGEFSVAFNAIIEGVPQVSAGNLIGGAVVLFLFIIPALAIAGDGLKMTFAISRKNLLFLLVLVGLPSLFTLDGELSRIEGITLIGLYVLLVRELKKRRTIEEIAKDTVERLERKLVHHRATAVDMTKIILGGGLILLAGNLLVDETVYFSTLFGIPASLIGLIILSVGTNIPELVIALRGVLQGKKDIALGNYLGSAAMNVVILGMLPIFAGSFTLPLREFAPTFVVLAVGLVLFGVFSKSNYDISRREGIALISLYGVFLLLQVRNLVVELLT